MNQALSLVPKDSSVASSAWVTRELSVIRTSLGRINGVDQAERLSQRAHAIAEVSERAKLSAEIKNEAAELVLRCERALGGAINAKPSGSHVNSSLDAAGKF